MSNSNLTAVAVGSVGHRAAFRRLKLWLDASNIDGKHNREMVHGDSVPVWHDLSGNGNAFAASENAPNLVQDGSTNLPLVNFDGDDMLESINYDDLAPLKKNNLPSLAPVESSYSPR